ncbi:hypothetical protein SAMN06298216_3543 [Spirosomataceae bacterium TFI 002]|nr:hypothetical protein SAMN06298216_3543 [Spirosomataceae bacterium TFI 002]
MSKIKISNQQRMLAGQAMHNGTKAIQQAAEFRSNEKSYLDARERRDEQAELRESGNIVLAILVIIGIIGLAVGSFYLGRTIWGELLLTYDEFGGRSYLLAGTISVVVTLALVITNTLIHSGTGMSFNEAGFSGNSNLGSNWVLFLFIFLRIGMGVLAWWLLQVSLSTYENFVMSYNELTYVAADLLLTVGEWMLSRWLGRHGITNLKYGLAGLSMRMNERRMDRRAEQTYERFYAQRRYVLLHNDANYLPAIEEQGSPNVERALNYHMGMNQDREPINDVHDTIPTAENTSQNVENLDQDLDDIVAETELDAEMSMEDYIREQEQSRTNNLFD